MKLLAGWRATGCMTRTLRRHGRSNRRTGGQRRCLPCWGALLVASIVFPDDFNDAEAVADLGDLAFLYQKFANYAFKRRRDFNAGFVALDFTQRVERLDRRRGLDAPADDLALGNACVLSIQELNALAGIKPNLLLCQQALHACIKHGNRNRRMFDSRNVWRVCLCLASAAASLNATIRVSARVNGLSERSRDLLSDSIACWDKNKLRLAPQAPM